jgi:hypothetical protein
MGQQAMFEPPTAGYKEQVFYHQMAASADSVTTAAILNPVLTFGAYLRYSVRSLPQFTQWKMMGVRDYVLGLEPGTCNPCGRAEAFGNGQLLWLKPGQSHRTWLELGVLANRDEMNACTQLIQRISHPAPYLNAPAPQTGGAERRDGR